MIDRATREQLLQADQAIRETAVQLELANARADELSAAADAAEEKVQRLCEIVHHEVKLLRAALTEMKDGATHEALASAVQDTCARLSIAFSPRSHLPRQRMQTELLPPICYKCDDTGKVAMNIPGGSSVGVGPCSCPAGQKWAHEKCSRDAVGGSPEEYATRVEVKTHNWPTPDELVGRTIVGYEPREFTDSLTNEPRHDPIITLDNGTRLGFTQEGDPDSEAVGVIVTLHAPPLWPQMYAGESAVTEAAAAARVRRECPDYESLLDRFLRVEACANDLVLEQARTDNQRAMAVEEELKREIDKGVEDVRRVADEVVRGIVGLAAKARPTEKTTNGKEGSND